MKLLNVIFFSAFLLTLSACVKTEENMGYMTGETHFDEVKIGTSTKKEVQKILGSPSSKSSFGEETWYYIGTKVERTAFLDPDIIEQNVVYIKFNKEDIVQDMGRKSAEDGREISFSEDKTSTEGNELTILEQLLGNLGRFNAADKR